MVTGKRERSAGTKYLLIAMATAILIACVAALSGGFGFVREHSVLFLVFLLATVIVLDALL